MILSINLAILTFLSFLTNFLKHFRVGRYENLFIFFWKAIKIAGSAHKKNRVGRVSGNTDFFVVVVVVFFGVFLGITCLWPDRMRLCLVCGRSRVQSSDPATSFMEIGHEIISSTTLSVLLK